MRLQYCVTCTSHVLVEIVVEHRRQTAVEQKPRVIVQKVMADHRGEGPRYRRECSDYGVVVCANGIYRVDAWVVPEGSEDRVFEGTVDTRIGDLYE